MRRQAMKYLVLAASAAMVSNAGNAATTTGNLSVTATVTSACLVVTLPVAFGIYDPTSGTPTDATGSVTVTCTFGTTYTIALDDGANPGMAGDVNTRRMLANASDYLPYNLYLDAGHATVWGDGISGSLNPTTGSFTATGLPQAYSVYGRIPINQYVAGGAYLDTVVATVTYN